MAAVITKAWTSFRISSPQGQGNNFRFDGIVSPSFEGFGKLPKANVGVAWGAFLVVLLRFFQMTMIRVCFVCSTRMELTVRSLESHSFASYVLRCSVLCCSLSLSHLVLVTQSPRCKFCGSDEWDDRLVRKETSKSEFCKGPLRVVRVYFIVVCLAFHSHISLSTDMHLYTTFIDFFCCSLPAKPRKRTARGKHVLLALQGRQ